MSEPLSGTVSSLWRHPVKGFTPESLERVLLETGAHFPCDRLFSVEDGPSGFDPAAPEHISKMRFTVLARLPQVAAIRTRYDEATGTLTASHPEFGEVQAELATLEGATRFAGWLTGVLGEAARGPLRVLAAPPRHRFMDSRSGFVSIINLSSLRDLEARIGRPVDPLRFRGNILVDGWPAWGEHELEGRVLTIGSARLKGLKRIARCAATNADPQTAERDIDMTRELYNHYGHMDCGLYAEVVGGGPIACGDEARA